MALGGAVARIEKINYDWQYLYEEIYMTEAMSCNGLILFLGI